jgi:hypothetical protein
MYLIIHETSITALKNILKANQLLKSSKIKELGLSTFQGSKNRRLADDPKVSLVDRDFSQKYDEVDGVYFRLLTVDTPIKLNYGGECVLVFSKDILMDKTNFVINTEENFGFCIAEDGIVAESQFSGEEGMSITNLKNFGLLKGYHFNHYSSEILINDNIDLKYLKTVFVLKHLLNEKLMDECSNKNISLYAL